VAMTSVSAIPYRMGFSHILVPVDGSEGSRRAVVHALELAAATGARLTLIEVIEEEGALPTYDERPPPGHTREAWLSEERWRPIAEVLEGSQVPWERRVEQGYPAEVIVQVCESADVDLVVMGSRGLRGVGRFLVGSVSDRVVHHAPCSVMVVK
jgi:nucleotide-binding universal stress UspA family protein